MASPRRICVVTSYMASTEPRAPRHAIAAKRAFPIAEVILVDLAADGAPRQADPELLSGQGIARSTVVFPSRSNGIVNLAARKLKTRVGRVAFSGLGVIHQSVFGDRTQGLTRALMNLPADIYIAHNIETLLPAFEAARRHHALLMFDCMEFYSDMGDSQHPTEAAAARALEAKVLPHCALVIASSDIMADSLATIYGIERPLAAYNVPPTESVLPARRGGGLNLYWRNSTIGFGQRGLEDVLDAMVMLPATVNLYLQGRQTPAMSSELTARVTARELQGRVHVLPPYMAHEAVQNAAIYDIGLCLERKGPRNHDFTVSNKMFDYHMAGLAVIATDLPALADVIKRSGGGVVCQPGDPRSLAATIDELLQSPDRLQDLRGEARRFALDVGNIEIEIARISEAMISAVQRRRVAA